MNSLSILFSSFDNNDPTIEIYDKIQYSLMMTMFDVGARKCLEKYNMVEITDIKGKIETIEESIKDVINFVSNFYSKDKNGFVLYVTLDSNTIDEKSTYGEKIKILADNGFVPQELENDIYYIWKYTELGEELIKEGEK